MLVEEAKVQLNSGDGAFNDAYLYEWWCLLWTIHNSSKNPHAATMPPPPMPPNRFDPRQFQDQQLPQQQPQQLQQQQQQFGQPQMPQQQQQQPPPPPQQQQPQPVQAPPQSQPTKKQTKKAAAAERTPKTTSKAASSATTPAAPSAGSQAGLESLAIMVPGQVPLTVGKGQPPAKRQNSANVSMQRPQLQPQQRAAVSQQQMGRRALGPGQRKQKSAAAAAAPMNNQQNHMSMGNVPMGQHNEPPGQNQNFAMSQMNVPSSAPHSATSSGPNSDPNLKPNSEPNLTNFALQPQPMLPTGMNNGDSGHLSNGQPDGLNMDNDFGMNFLGADLNMDLNGFDMTSMLK